MGGLGRTVAVWLSGLVGPGPGTCDTNHKPIYAKVLDKEPDF